MSGQAEVQGNASPVLCTCGTLRSNEYRGRDGWWHCFECDERVEQIDPVPPGRLRKPTPAQVERVRERHQERRAVRGPEPAADQLRKEGT